jgi:predicted nucleotidyltransferase
MKTLQETKTQLELLKPVLKERFQVETIGIFGSYTRGEQKKKSDIDILVTFTESNDIDLLDFIALKRFLSRKLGAKVDVVEKDALKHRIKDKILQETFTYKKRQPFLKD